MTKTAIVTGAAGGIGSAICKRLAGEGWTLIAVDASPRLADTVSILEEAEAKVRPVEANLTTDEGLDMVGSAIEGAPPLELIVNNAGITRDARLVNMTEDEFASVIDVNLGAPYQIISRFAPMMKEGAIVNISSRAYLGNFGQFNYSMSKGALVGITRAFALTLAPRIRVNAIAPGLIGTEMSMAIPADVRERMVDSIPLGRMGEPEEVADLVVFLARPGYITGEVITVGGGRSLSR
ncbi:MAG: SDR family oxidoreductase [Acidimicrobiia bacterium]